MDPTRDYDLDSAGTAPTALDPNGVTAASRRRPKAAFLLVASLVLLALAAGVVVAVGSAGGSQETSSASRVRAQGAAVSATTTTSTTTSTTTTTAPPMVEEPAPAPTRSPVVSAPEPMPEAPPAPPPPSDFVMPTGLMWRITSCNWVPDFPDSDWGTLSYDWIQWAVGGSGFVIISNESGSGSGYRFTRRWGQATNAGIPIPMNPIIQVLSTGEVMPVKYFPQRASDSLREPGDCAGFPGYIA